MNNFESLFSALKRITLSEREKNTMRVHVRAFMQEHPVRMTLYQRVRNYFQVSESSRFILRPVFATLALFMTVGLGTSFAAEGALPGDALYAMKTGFNERLQGSLALSPVAKAEWSASLSGRRLEEAEVLAASGRLDPVALATVESGFDAAVSEFDANLTVLAMAHGDERVVSAQSDLEASLKAHEDVIASLSNTSDSAKDSLGSLAAIVRSKSSNTSRSRNTVELAVAKKTDTSAKIAALNKGDEAEAEMASMTMMAMSAPDHVSNDAAATPPDPANVEAALMMATDSVDDSDARMAAYAATTAQKQIQKGESEAKNQRWGSAFSAFEAAVRAVKETRANIEARKKLKTTLGVHLVATSTTEVKSSGSGNSKKPTTPKGVPESSGSSGSSGLSGSSIQNNTNVEKVDDSNQDGADDSRDDSSHEDKSKDDSDQTQDSTSKNSGDVKIDTKNIFNISTDLLR